MLKKMGFAAVAALLFIAPEAFAAADPGLVCQSAKLKLSGGYAAGIDEIATTQLHRHAAANTALLVVVPAPAVAVTLMSLLVVESRLNVLQIAIVVALVVAATVAWAGLFDRRSWAAPLEAARLVASAVVVAWIAIA